MYLCEHDLNFSVLHLCVWSYSLLETPFNRMQHRHCNWYLCLSLFQIKCDQYWPSRGTETYGMTQVTLLDTIELATFCVRTFSLHKVGWFIFLSLSLSQTHISNIHIQYVHLHFANKIQPLYLLSSWITMNINMLIQRLSSKHRAHTQSLHRQQTWWHKPQAVSIWCKGLYITLCPLCPSRQPILPCLTLHVINRSSIYVHLPNWST